MGYQNKIRRGLFVVACLAAATAHAEYEQWSGVNFFAERNIYAMDKPEAMEKSKVYFSLTGTRIESGAGADQGISIVNYQQQKCWFAHPGRKIYYEVAYHPESKQCDKLDIAGFHPETLRHGLFSPRPCYSYKSIKNLGEEPVAGRRATKWQCTDDSGTTVLQWFDFSLHMVYREVRNNRVAEGSQIKLSRKLQDKLLEPPRGFTLQKNP